MATCSDLNIYLIKKITLLTLIFLASITSQAQITEVVNPAEGGPTGFTIVGNELYYTKYSGAISKFDTTAPTPTTPIDVFTGLSAPEGILYIGNNLYFTQSANKLCKIDLTAATPTIIDVALGLDEPFGLAINGNDLYISEVNGGKISKIDITAPTPTTAVDVITGLNVPLDLALNGNDLYIVEVEADKISKIDITAVTPTAVDVVTGLNKPLHIELSGSVLYISEAEGNKISKIDITAATPTTAVTVVDGLSSPECLALHGNDLYFSSFPDASPNLISKLDLASLSLDNEYNMQSLKIFPNPTSDHIQVSGIMTELNYIIYDFLGKEISTGTISAQNKIDIQNLSKETYLLKTQGENLEKYFKIIKE